MTRDNVNVIFPQLDGTKCIASAEINESTVTQANGTKLIGAFGGKDNSLQIKIKNSSGTASTVTLKSGEIEPNNVMGDLTIPVAAGKTAVILVENPSRFQNKDGSLLIDYATGFTGTVYAVAKHAGLKG